MTAYVVGRVEMKDPSWAAGYIPAVQEIVESHGGKYIVRSPEFEVVEANGDAPHVMVVVEFPDQAAAKAFYNDPAYKPWLDARKAGANTELVLVDGL